MNKSNELGNFIKMIIIVVVIFLAFYLITIFTTKNKENEYTPKTPTPAVIQYEEIILGEIYNQKENEYYVMISDKEDPYMKLFSNLITKYKSKDNALVVYTADIKNAFNKKYISDVSSFETENLKVKETVMIKIKDKQIIEHYEGDTNILNALKELNK